MTAKATRRRSAAPSRKPPSNLAPRLPRRYSEALGSRQFGFAMPMPSRLVALAAALLLSTGAAYAQQGAKKNAAPAAQAAQPAPAPTQPQADGAPAQQPGWIARCTSVSRDAPLECAIEQNAVLTKTGQTIVLINIRIAPDTRTPVALLQLPLGLNLPIGAKARRSTSRSRPARTAAATPRRRSRRTCSRPCGQASS